MIEYIHSLAKDEKRGIIAAFFKLVLLLLSFVYRFILLLMNIAYKSKILKVTRLNCKVISVGNITCGGTGKTPFVKMLVEHLSGKGKNVAILIRGYKRELKNSNLQVADIATMGDEGYLLNKDTNVPVLVGRDRIKTAREARDRYNTDMIILDDAFQHWRLHRDLDIVLINSLNPFGNNQVIPRGILREPPSALKRADIFVLTKTDLATDIIELKDRLKTVNSKALVVEAVHKPVYFQDLSGQRIELPCVKDKQVCVFSALADPYSFAKTISNLGGQIKLKFEFSDHYSYQQKDMDEIFSQCSQLGIDTVITTEKDMVKLLPSCAGRSVRLLILKIELQITKNEQEFYSRLLRT